MIYIIKISKIESVYNSDIKKEINVLAKNEELIRIISCRFYLNFN